MGDLTACIAELRDALAVSGSVFAGYGGPWDCELQRCLASRPPPPDQVGSRPFGFGISGIKGFPRSGTGESQAASLLHAYSVEGGRPGPFD